MHWMIRAVRTSDRTNRTKPFRVGVIGENRDVVEVGGIAEVVSMIFAGGESHACQGKREPSATPGIPADRPSACSRRPRRRASTAGVASEIGGHRHDERARPSRQPRRTNSPRTGNAMEANHERLA